MRDGFGGAVDERVRPVATVLDLVGANALNLGEVDVKEEFVSLF